MSRLLKAGVSIDVRHLQQLAQRKRWSFVVAAAGVASLAVGNDGCLGHQELEWCYSCTRCR
jgi:hypothetical protein